MKTKHILLIILFAFVSLQCKKEDPVLTPSILSGKWRVDSVQLNSYEDGIQSIGMTTINFPHTLNFSLKDQVIEKMFGNSDTCLFLQSDPYSALSDLDRNGKVDTLDLTWPSGENVNLEWVSSLNIIGNVEYKSVTTYFMAK